MSCSIFSMWLKGRYEKREAPPVWAVEVGVHRGENAGRMLAELPALRLVMVDHWHVGIDEEEIDPYYSKYGGKKNYDRMIEATDEFWPRRVVVPLDSLSASKLFADGFFDFVFLDGDHREDAVLADLHAWWPKVREGGAMLGHDLDFRKGAWGVREALDRFGKKFEKIGGGCFLIEK